MCSGCAGNYSGDYENWDPDLSGDAADYGVDGGLRGDEKPGIAGEMGSGDWLSAAAEVFVGSNPTQRVRSECECRPSLADSALTAPGSHGREEPLGADDFEVMVSADRIVEIRVIRDKAFRHSGLQCDTSARVAAPEQPQDNRLDVESAKDYRTNSGSEEFVRVFRRAWAISCVCLGIAAALLAGAAAVFFLRR